MKISIEFIDSLEYLVKIIVRNFLFDAYKYQYHFTITKWTHNASDKIIPNGKKKFTP